MSPEHIRALIAGGETLAVEFKGEEAARFSDRELVNTVICLANGSSSDSGWLLVGVEDDGRVSGARPRHESGSTDLLRVQALIANRTRPSLVVRTELFSFDGKEILCIEIPISYEPVGTSDGHYLRRIIDGTGRPSCVPFHFHEMRSRQSDFGLDDYTELQVEGVEFDALDPLEFERYRRRIREHPHQGDQALLELGDLELARALGAVEYTDGDAPVTILGLLLFGREEILASKIRTHEAAFQVLSGTDVEVNDFLRWPLLRLMEEFEARFRARKRETEILVRLSRIGIPDYSEAAFREGLANALTHRDYRCLGAVHVQWHSDRLEISNPGGFPVGVRPNNLLVTRPRSRNPLLADAFKRAGIVERAARGIDTIFMEQLRTGRRVPSYELSTEMDTVLELPGGEANLGFVRFVTERYQEDCPFSLNELLLLSAFRNGHRMTVPDAAATIQRGMDEAEAVLSKLSEGGLVKMRTVAGRALFQLTEKVSLRLGDHTDAFRGRAEPIQHYDNVLRYLEAHDSVSRKEVAELCAISTSQAYRLLKKMEAEGSVHRAGTMGRNVRYVKVHGTTGRAFKSIQLQSQPGGVGHFGGKPN